MQKRYSILYPLTTCYVCKVTVKNKPIQIHEVFFGNAYRSKSIKYGCCVGLCQEHHTGDYGVHHDMSLNLELKRAYETELIRRYGFDWYMAMFHKNYLDDAQIEYAEMMHKRGE